MLRPVDVVGRVALQDVNFQFLRREKALRARREIAGVIPRVVVRSLDVSRQLVPQVELLAAEALQHLRIAVVLGLHVILQTFVACERRRAQSAQDLHPIFFGDVLCDVLRHVALEERSKAANVAKN